MKSLSVSESFKKRADSAAFYEAWVGSVLARGGLYTVHHPFTVAAAAKDIPAYAHTWDLDVSTGNPYDFDTNALRVEVKSLSLSFRAAADYPYDGLLVCSQKSFLNKWPGSDKTLRDFLFVSRDTGSVVWLPRGTMVELGHEVLDKSRNQLYKAVRAKKSDLKDLADFIDCVKVVCDG